MLIVRLFFFSQLFSCLFLKKVFPSFFFKMLSRKLPSGNTVFIYYEWIIINQSDPSCRCKQRQAAIYYCLRFSQLLVDLADSHVYSTFNHSMRTLSRLMWMILELSRNTYLHEHSRWSIIYNEISHTRVHVPIIYRCNQYSYRKFHFATSRR